MTRAEELAAIEAYAAAGKVKVIPRGQVSVWDDLDARERHKLRTKYQINSAKAVRKAKERKGK